MPLATHTTKHEKSTGLIVMANGITTRAVSTQPINTQMAFNVDQYKTETDLKLTQNTFLSLAVTFFLLIQTLYPPSLNFYN